MFFNNSNIFEDSYHKQLEEWTLNPPSGFEVYPSLKIQKDVGEHPSDFTDFECAFAANAIAELRPHTILDIGSYRKFVIGLLASYEIISIDTRPREVLFNEQLITCDAKTLDVQSDTFDIVLSLCSIEHFGLGRYGDEYDMTADVKAVKEMWRVIKPGGYLIFSVPITKYKPTILFNAHRIYDYAMIKNLCKGMTLISESWFNRGTNQSCSIDEVCNAKYAWDIYCGCWRKGD